MIFSDINIQDTINAKRSSVIPKLENGAFF